MQFYIARFYRYILVEFYLSFFLQYFMQLTGHSRSL